MIYPGHCRSTEANIPALPSMCKATYFSSVNGSFWDTEDPTSGSAASRTISVRARASKTPAPRVSPLRELSLQAFLWTSETATTEPQKTYSRRFPNYGHHLTLAPLPPWPYWFAAQSPLIHPFTSEARMKDVQPLSDITHMFRYVWCFSCFLTHFYA